MELITISIVTIRSIWHNSAADFVSFIKFSPQICDSCGATYRWNYEMFSASNKRHPNRSINGDAIRYPFSNCCNNDENMRSKICRSAVAPSNTTEKTAIRLHNYIPLDTQQPQRYFGKFTSCMTLGAHNLVRSEPFWGHPCELLQ